MNEIHVYVHISKIMYTYASLRAGVCGQTGDVLGATQQVTEIALLTGCQMMAYGWQAIP